MAPSPARKEEGPVSFSEGHYSLRLAPEVFGVSVEVQKGRLVRISIREGEDPRAAVLIPTRWADGPQPCINTNVYFIRQTSALKSSN